MSDVFHGVDASRRAGWRKYYRAQEEADRLRRVLMEPHSRRAELSALACEELLKQAAEAFLSNGGRVEDENGYVNDFVFLAENALFAAR